MKYIIHNRYKKEYVEYVFVLLLFFVIQTTLQVVNGSFKNEFGGSPDESGHYVTGLMVRDYISGSKFENPMGFAENYYIHYPKVSLGHWPPFFYIVQAVWTLLFPPSRFFVVLLMIFLSTTLSYTVYATIKKEFCATIAVGLGALLLTLPLIQQYSGMVMAEILVALLSLWSILFFGRYLDTMTWRSSIGFSICLFLAIMTKGNGLALVFVPPLALLLSRRLHLITHSSFWVPFVMALLCCAPWYWLTLGMVQNGMQEGSPSLSFTLAAIPYYSYHLIKIMGVGLSLLATVGFLVRIVYPYRDGTVTGKWASCGALVLSVWIFHVATPSGLDERHLTMVVPGLVMFLAPALVAIASCLAWRHGSQRRKVTVLAMAVVLMFMGETFALPIKAWYGFGEVVRHVLSAPAYRKSVIMVSSDSFGDGMFIAEVASRERRPGHVVLRASKMLAHSRWDGSNYDILYRTPEEIMHYLESIPVGILVIDHSIPVDQRTEDFQLLIKMLDVYANRWEPLGAYSLTRRGTVHLNAIRVYRLRGHENRPVGTIRLDMREMLNRSIEKTFNK